MEVAINSVGSLPRQERPLLLTLVSDCRVGGGTGAKPTCDPAVPTKDVSSFMVEDGDRVLAAKDQAPFKLDNSSGWHDVGCFGTAVNVGVFDGNITYTDTGLNPGR
ncbi:hypothetical protein QFC19_001795 [Naganishia cerealis]|uniref:Uncharacterized protein n=1 Tax=Naganishia cerealis TaxID=610337 RepID=A0ACC2WEC5_9TREE|nr:hypothetical protein QFC19_001795 [Naganishia cerealis]